LVHVGGFLHFPARQRSSTHGTWRDRISALWDHRLHWTWTVARELTRPL